MNPHATRNGERVDPARVRWLVTGSFGSPPAAWPRYNVSFWCGPFGVEVWRHGRVERVG